MPDQRSTTFSKGLPVLFTLLAAICRSSAGTVSNIPTDGGGVRSLSVTAAVLKQCEQNCYPGSAEDGQQSRTAEELGQNEDFVECFFDAYEVSFSLSWLDCRVLFWLKRYVQQLW